MKTLTEIYCPKCGESREYPHVQIWPGESKFECNSCGAEFVLKIEFIEVESRNEDD